MFLFATLVVLAMAVGCLLLAQHYGRQGRRMSQMFAWAGTFLGVLAWFVALSFEIMLAMFIASCALLMFGRPPRTKQLDGSHETVLEARTYMNAAEADTAVTTQADFNRKFADLTTTDPELRQLEQRRRRLPRLLRRKH